jgi:hypothetical protein
MTIHVDQNTPRINPSAGKRAFGSVGAARKKSPAIPPREPPGGGLKLS